MRAVQEMGAWLVRFQRKTKILRGLLCEESMALESQSYRISCD